MWNLIQLLNDYEKTLNKQQPFYWDEQNIYVDYHTCYICSKQYGFIKWLVGKEKIDYENDILYGMNIYHNGNQLFLNSEDEIIMQLAISYNPLNDLINLLN